MEIETERLLLRMFEPEDAEPFYRVISTPGFGTYLPPDFVPTPEIARSAISRKLQHWDLRGFGQWAMSPKGTRQFLGYCGLRLLPDTEEIELLYGMDKSQWGKGLTTEAARASVRFGFEEARVDRIMAIANPDNDASRRVMEKAGLRYEKNAVYFGMECAYYALNREDYAPDSSAYVLLVDRGDNY
jgi:ribosomal-protein-alanine N-acetyltransferase